MCVHNVIKVGRSNNLPVVRPVYMKLSCVLHVLFVVEYLRVKAEKWECCAGGILLSVY